MTAAQGGFFEVANNIPGQMYVNDAPELKVRTAAGWVRTVLA
jgi:hypothetical protein